MLFVAAALTLPTSATLALEARAVTLATATGTLAGTLTMPSGEPPVPAVLLWAGSGPVDRQGNLPGLINNSLGNLAEALGREGIAVLRTDKRGIGESRAAGADEQDLRFTTYVDDMVLWARWLARQPRVARVFLAGHSEGALVATLAAGGVPASGLVLIAGAGEPAGRLILRQIAEAGLSPGLRNEAQRIVGTLCGGRPAGAVPADLWPLFRPAVQPYLMSWLPLDPVQALAETQLPVLIVSGGRDLQIDAEQGRRLAAARPGIRLVEIATMNHVLKDAPADAVGNHALYRDPDAPPAAGLAGTIAAFVRQEQVDTFRPD